MCVSRRKNKTRVIFFSLVNRWQKQWLNVIGHIKNFVNLKDKHNKSPIDYALEDGHTNMYNFLLEVSKIGN